MAYTFHELALGLPGIATVDTVQATGVGRIARATDPSYGDAEFIFLKANSTIAVGATCTYNKQTGIAVAWAGTANTAAPLCISANALTTGQWGWFYISGAAIAAISGTVAAGNPMYYQAAGVLSATPVAGKQVLGATADSANGVPGAGFAIVEINRPSVQGQLT